MMSKKLCIIRHAHAADPTATTTDFDRPLTLKGKSEAKAVGHFLCKEGYIPSSIISSCALRALSTAKIIASECDYAEHAIVTDPSLYHADIDTILSLIAGVADTHHRLYIVGHNPVLSELVNYLIPAIHRSHALSPCCVAQLELAITHWTDIAAHCGELSHFSFPDAL